MKTVLLSTIYRRVTNIQKITLSGILNNMQLCKTSWIENSSKRIQNSTMQLVSKLMGLSLLLLLLCQQSQPEEIKAPAFFKHCHDIFRQEGMVAMVIKSILDKVMDRLQKACVVDEYIAKVPNIIGGGLYCDLNLPHTVDMLLSYVKDNADRDCRKIDGFMSRYLLF